MIEEGFREIASDLEGIARGVLFSAIADSGCELSEDIGANLEAFLLS